jgi:hypothetical protein
MSLNDDLINAGLPVSGIAIEGTTVLFTRGLTLQELDKYESIINPAGYREKKAKSIAKAIPNWATWTQQDWATYFGANLSDTEIDAQVATISTLATAKTVIAIMWKRQNKILDSLAKMEIAMRDQVWPDLPG